MKIRKLWMVLPGWTLCALPLLAAEGAKQEAGASEIWKWANFAILAGVLGWLIAKHMGPALVARSQQIHQGLAAGEKAKAEAEARSAAVQARLMSLESTVAQMKTSAREELARETDRLRHETEAELARIEQHAAQDVESAGKLARLELQRSAARLAIDLAEQKVRSRMSSDKQAELVQNFATGLAHGTQT